MFPLTKQEVFKDKDTWNNIVSDYSDELNPTGLHFSDYNFDGYNFSRTSFSSCTFERCDFSKAKFTQTKAATNKESSKFIECVFSNLNIEGNQFTFNHATFDKCIFNNFAANKASFQFSNFFNCKWHGAKIKKSHFDNSSFLGSDFSNAKLKFCILTNTMWQDVTLNCNTQFEYCVFVPKNSTVKHDVLNDKSDKIKFASPHQFWNWKLISKIGRVPALEFSWSLFGIGLFILSTLIFLNETQFIQDGIKYPIPIPDQLKLMTLGAFFTSIGTFFFRAGCPDRIQNFTENEWVEGHGHPRVLYREYCVKNTTWLIWTTIFLILGMCVLGWIISCRMFYVISHLLF